MRVRYVWTETPLTTFANPVVGSRNASLSVPMALDLLVSFASAELGSDLSRPVPAAQPRHHAGPR
jgi:hypothetical protein